MSRRGLSNTNQRLSLSAHALVHDPGLVGHAPVLRHHPLGLGLRPSLQWMQPVSVYLSLLFVRVVLLSRIQRTARIELVSYSTLFINPVTPGKMRERHCSKLFSLGVYMSRQPGRWQPGVTLEKVWILSRDIMS